MGHCGDHRTADEIRQDRRHRRPGPLCDPRPAAECELPGLGPRLRSGGFAQTAREARPAAQPYGGAGAERGGRGALLPGDLLVHDDEDPAGQGFRRQHRYSEGDHAGHLAPADEQCRLHRLPSAWPGSHAYDPGRVRRIQIRRGGVDAPRRLGANRRMDGEPACRAARRRSVQVFRRLDRPGGQGRTTQVQAAAAGRHRAQRRHLLVGVGHGEALRPRSDFLGPAQSDRQRLRPAVRFERILVRRHADPRSEDAQGDILQNAGRRSERAGVVWAAAPSQCHRQADRRFGLLGRGENLEPEGEQPQRHVRQEGPGVVRRGRARHRKSGLLQEGLRPSLGQGVSARTLAAASVDARSQDHEVQFHRHLFWHPSPAVRLRRRQYVVVLRERSGRRLGQHKDMG